MLWSFISGVPQGFVPGLLLFPIIFYVSASIFMALDLHSCHICTIGSNAIEYKNCTRWGPYVARDGAIWLADVSAIKHLQSVQMRAGKALFLKLMWAVLKHVPLERWIQHVIGGLKTVNLAWVNKFAVIGCTWLSVYESALTYKGRMNAAPGQ